MNASLRYYEIQRSSLAATILFLEEELQKERDRQTDIAGKERQRYYFGIKPLEAQIKRQRKKLREVEKTILSRSEFVINWYAKKTHILDELKAQREKLRGLDMRANELKMLSNIAPFSKTKTLAPLDPEQINFLTNYKQNRDRTHKRINILITQYQHHLRIKPSDSLQKAQELTKFIDEIKSDIKKIERSERVEDNLDFIQDITDIQDNSIKLPETDISAISTLFNLKNQRGE